MDISQFIYPTSNKSIMKMLRKKVAELRSSIRILEQRGIVRDPGLEAALQDAEELRDLLARGREKLFQFGMYVTLYAEDEAKLKKLQTDIESFLGGKLVLTKPAHLPDGTCLHEHAAALPRRTGDQSQHEHVAARDELPLLQL
jgi:conjugal transfer ATP-binding protein TraC